MKKIILFLILFFLNGCAKNNEEQVVYEEKEESNKNNPEKETPEQVAPCLTSFENVNDQSTSFNLISPQYKYDYHQIPQMNKDEYNVMIDDIGDFSELPLVNATKVGDRYKLKFINIPTFSGYVNVRWVPFQSPGEYFISYNLNTMELDESLDTLSFESEDSYDFEGHPIIEASTEGDEGHPIFYKVDLSKSE